MNLRSREERCYGQVRMHLPSAWPSGTTLNTMHIDGLSTVRSKRKSRAFCAQLLSLSVSFKGLFPG